MKRRPTDTRTLRELADQMAVGYSYQTWGTRVLHAAQDIDELRDLLRRVITMTLEGADGGDVQVWAASVGLMKEVEVTEPCGDCCTCAEVGLPAICYQFTPTAGGTA